MHEKEGWTFYYFPLTEAEAKAEKTTAETKLGRKDVFTVEFSKRAASFFIQPKCPDAAPDELGWTTWTACFSTEAKANAQVKKFRDAHIEAQTGKLQEDQFYVLFQAAHGSEAKAKGEAEARTRGGFAEGMFTVKPGRCLSSAAGRMTSSRLPEGLQVARQIQDHQLFHHGRSLVPRAAYGRRTRWA